MQILFQTRCPALIMLVFVCSYSILCGCTQKSHGSPEGYDFRTPQKRELGKVLNEISGLNYNPENHTLLAISDSKRKIFQIDVKKQKLKDYAEKFSKQADFEDIVKLNNTVYVLVSDGTIMSVPPNAKDSSGTVSYPFWSKDKNDFETMYYDSVANGLIIICKSCAKDKNQGVKSAYRFDLGKKRFDSSKFYAISTDSVRSAVRNNDANFKPSAAAIHPINQRLYILSSAGQLLVVTDTRGKVIEAFNLNPDRNPQAEGIAFSPHGTLFISNEGKYGKATLQIFPYKGHRISDKISNR